MHAFAGWKPEEAADKLPGLCRREYDRILQSEERPELIINLPKAAQDAPSDEPMVEASVKIVYVAHSDKANFHCGQNCCYIESQVYTVYTSLSCILLLHSVSCIYILLLDT